MDALPTAVDDENVSALDDEDDTKARHLKTPRMLELGAEKQEENYGFAHPAASRPQWTVWIPKDEFGLAEAEEATCKEAGCG